MKIYNFESSRSTFKQIKDNLKSMGHHNGTFLRGRVVWKWDHTSVGEERDRHRPGNSLHATTTTEPVHSLEGKGNC